MISLRFFLLILGVLIGREWASESSLRSFDSGYALPMMAMVLLGFVVTVKLAAISAIHRASLNGVRYDWLAREYFSLARVRIERIWCTVLPLVMLGGWTQWTCQMQADGWPHSLMLLICFLPSVLYLITSELIAAQLDRVGNQLAGSTLLQNWLTRIRLGELSGLITCVLPILLLVLASDLSNLAHVRWGWDRSIVSVALTGFVVVTFVFLLPELLTRWLGSQQLSTELQHKVDWLLSSANVRGCKTARIGTDGRWAGAAIVGWLPGFRRLWLGDGLLRSLNRQQVEMVILHELAHIVRFHFAWRMMPVVGAMVAGATAWYLAQQIGLGDSLITKLSSGLSASLLMIVGLGRVARQCELDADVTACQLALRAGIWHDAGNPAEILSAALTSLLENSPAAATTWLHPSLQDRVEHLARWSSGLQGISISRRPSVAIPEQSELPEQPELAEVTAHQLSVVE